MPLNYQDLIGGFANQFQQNPLAPPVSPFGGLGGAFNSGPSSMDLNAWRNLPSAPMDFNAMAGGLSGGVYQPPVRSVNFNFGTGTGLVEPAPGTMPTPPIQGGLIPGVSPGVPNIGAPGFVAMPSFPPIPPGLPLGEIPSDIFVPPPPAFENPEVPAVPETNNPWIPDSLEGIFASIGDAFSNTGFGPNHGTGIGTGETWEGLGGNADFGNGVVDPNIGGINPDSGRNLLGGRGSLGFNLLRQQGLL